jgi:hypothetical protein
MMFCDEPTSGLDSTAALKVVTTLKSISKLGVSVITVLHQPRFEIFEQFDDIILIFPGGRIAYFGPRQDAQSYFESLGYIFDPRVNPADVFMDILSGESKLNNSKIKLADLCDNWEQKNSPVETEPQKMSEISKLVRVSSPFWYQFWLAHNRSLIQQCRNIKSLILEIGVAILAGSLIGLSVMGSGGQMFHGIYKWPYSLISPAPIVWVVPLLGLLTSTAVGLAGAPAGVKTFGEERVVFWREAAVGHNRFSYYTGKSVSVLYRILLTSLHFSSIYYYLAAPIISFGKEYAIIFLLFYCVYGLSSIISMIVRREDAPLLAVVACLFSSVFCGFGPSLVDAKGWGLLWFWESMFTYLFSVSLNDF